MKVVIFLNTSQDDVALSVLHDIVRCLKMLYIKQSYLIMLQFVFFPLIHKLNCPISVGHLFPQALIKDPKISSIVMNPHVKRSIKQKTFHDALAKAKVSPITVNLISESSLTWAKWPFCFSALVLWLNMEVILIIHKQPIVGSVRCNINAVYYTAL